MIDWQNSFSSSIFIMEITSTSFGAPRPPSPASQTSLPPHALCSCCIISLRSKPYSLYACKLLTVRMYALACIHCNLHDRKRLLTMRNCAHHTLMRAGHMRMCALTLCACSIFKLLHVCVHEMFAARSPPPLRPAMRHHTSRHITPSPDILVILRIRQPMQTVKQAERSGSRGEKASQKKTQWCAEVGSTTCLSARNSRNSGKYLFLSSFAHIFRRSDSLHRPRTGGNIN
jgi:hypothetical protein